MNAQCNLHSNVDLEDVSRSRADRSGARRLTCGALSANFGGVTFPTFDTANPREISRRVHVDVYSGVHNSGFSVALGRLSLRIVPGVARYRMAVRGAP